MEIEDPHDKFKGDEDVPLRYRYKTKKFGRAKSNKQSSLKVFGNVFAWLCSINIDRVLLLLLFSMTLTCLVFLINQDVCWSHKDEMRLFSSIYRGSSVDTAIPLAKAHSHNDEEQAQPLHLALSAGYCSIEADIHADSGGSLHLGHYIPTEKTLTSTYLRPLKRLAMKQPGRPLFALASTLGVCEQITLLIDLKTDPVETWEILENEISRVNAEAGFRVFECYTGDKNNPLSSGVQFRGHSKSPVKVVVSGVENDKLGKFANHVLRSNQGAFCSTLDGRFDPDSLNLVWNSEIEKITSQISGAWTQRVQQGARALVESIHSKQIKLRLWDVPDNIDTWTKILDFGVDIISTDHLVTLASFLTRNLGT